VSDNKGGGASGRSWVVVTPGGSPGHAPSGTLTVPPTGTINVDVPITFAATDPDGPGFLGWELWASGNGGSSGWCCFTSSTVNIRFSAAGIYRISVQAMDRELLASPNYTALISIDGAVGNPPIARATLDKESGAAPLTVNIDMTGSTDDGSISNYYIGCGGTFTPGSTAGTGICTFTDPGVYWLLLQVRDNTGLMGLLSKYVVVTPPAGPPPPSDDTVAPTVNITSPTLNANLTKPMNLQATASDNPGGSGVKEVEYYLDSVSPNNSLGKASSAPYTVPWSAPENPGAHTIYAVARDNSGNEGAATPIPVTVTFVAPTITLISPSDGQIVPRKGTVNLTASVGGSFPPSAKGVEYLVNGALVCSSNVSSPNGAVLESFPCAWKAPAAVKSYTVQARVVDDHGNAVSSAIRTIYAR
jgi:hypothetical protein